MDARMTQRLSLCELSKEAQIRAAQRLRFSVWHSEGALIYNPEREMIADHHDDHAIHWGMFDGDLLVGAARLCLHGEIPEAPDGEMFVNRGLPTPIASMNRLVVLRSHRGLGIGGRLDELRVQRANDLGARAVIVTPADVVARRQALQRRGFQFLEGVVGHPSWSPTVQVCACYLIIERTERRTSRS
jgi:GNAT superfamily N-acetyltransferase